ncbi:MAG TPA: hypothetical protein VFL90_20120 [Methylomirabilota bacterium]|nr:hypothetical protein [Methylomirabilota bacterium]
MKGSPLRRRNGVLEYRGKQYPFTVKAFSIADVGVLKRSARGEVYNLKSPMGAGAAAMRNQHEVNMVWTTTNQGLGVTLAHSGIHVKFTDEARVLAARNRVPSADETPVAAPRSPR